jgi:type II secretory pathway pseudopilin PulG
MEAAHQAAQADGVLDPQNAALQQARNAMAMAAVANARHQQQQQAQQAAQQQQQQAKSANAKKKGPPLRRGKWTPEEEAYAARLIQEFKAGLLPLTDGTTLRTFLSKLLNCDPMRISKKFVGSNCIGKQVFRRRTADLNRLTPEQIQQSRAELSDLERRFLERVAQTNRVKSTGCAPPTGGGIPGGGVGLPQSIPGSQMPQQANNAGAAASAAAQQQMQQKNDLLQSLGMGGGGMGGGGMDFQQLQQQQQALGFAQQQQQQQASDQLSNPPWLQPPLGYKHGTGQAFAASHLSNANARAAAAGRALLGGVGSPSTSQNVATNHLAAAAQRGGSAGLLAMAELQRRASQNSLLQSALQQQHDATSANNLLAAAARSGSNSALQQMVRTASGTCIPFCFCTCLTCASVAFICKRAIS